MADKQAPMSEQQTRTRKCPTCESPSPGLHPAIQHEGEVSVCKDAWHDAARIPVGYERRPDGTLAALSSRPEGPQERSELVKRIEAQIRELNRMVNGAEPSGHLLTYGEEIQLLRDCIAALSSSPAVPPEPETPRKHAWVAQLRPGVIRCQNCGTIRSNLDFSGDPCAAPETGGPR
jgi:hypothetical protein